MPVPIDPILERLEIRKDPTVERVDAGPRLKSRVAVLPASFNPPTLAHVELLERAKDVPGIATSAALLTTRNVDKGLFGASHGHRVGMLLGLELPATGVLVSNAARIAEQAAALRDMFPGQDFDFVVGYDTLVRLFDRRYYDGEMHEVLATYFRHHRVIAATRGEFDVPAIERYVESTADARNYGDRIVPLNLESELMHVSSTAVRERIVEGVSVDVPPRVHQYIREHKLYEPAP